MPWLLWVNRRSILTALHPATVQDELLGGSSNYLVCDAPDGPDYNIVGDTIAFYCDYAAMATGMCSAYIGETLSVAN